MCVRTNSNNVLYIVCRIRISTRRMKSTLDFDIGSRPAHYLRCVELDRVDAPQTQTTIGQRKKDLGSLASLLSKTNNREAKSKAAKATKAKEEKRAKLSKLQGTPSSQALEAFRAASSDSKTIRGQRMVISQSTADPSCLMELLIQEGQEQVCDLHSYIMKFPSAGLSTPPPPPPPPLLLNISNNQDFKTAVKQERAKMVKRREQFVGENCGLMRKNMDQKQIMSNECNFIRVNSMKVAEDAHATLQRTQRKQLRAAKQKMAKQLEKVKELRIQNASEILEGDLNLERLVSWSKLTNDTNFLQNSEQHDASGNKEMNARFGKLNHNQAQTQMIQRSEQVSSPFTMLTKSIPDRLDPQDVTKSIPDTLPSMTSRQIAHFGEILSDTDMYDLKASMKNTREQAKSRWLKEPVQMLHHSSSSPQLALLESGCKPREYTSGKARLIQKHTQQILITMQIQSLTLNTIQQRKLAKKKATMEGKSTMLIITDVVPLDEHSERSKAQSSQNNITMDTEEALSQDKVDIEETDSPSPHSSDIINHHVQDSPRRKQKENTKRGSLVGIRRQTTIRSRPLTESLQERLQVAWNSLEVPNVAQLDFAIAHSETSEKAFQLSHSVKIWEQFLAVVNSLKELRGLEAKAPPPWTSSMISDELKMFLVEHQSTFLPVDYPFLCTEIAQTRALLTLGKMDHIIDGNNDKTSQLGAPAKTSTKILLAFDSLDILRDVTQKVENHGLKLVNDNLMLKSCPRMRQLVKGTAGRIQNNM
jgi:hypothetical protein